MNRNTFRAALGFFVLIWMSGANAQTLALVGGKVYASPDAAPLDDAVVVTANGVITAIGSRRDVQVPSDARVIDCTGKTVVAGFWNSHAHFTEAVWLNAGSAPAGPLTAHMQEMLTRWGFTSVWSLGSDPDNSMALRRRVYADEILGPNIFLVGSIFPRDGRPAYLPDARIPEAETPERAAEMARYYLKIGLDGIKLFTGAYKGEDKPVVNMEAAIAKAAVDVAHAQGKPVFAHPQNTAGIEAVIAAGVDVMAHTVGRQPGYSVELQRAGDCADADLVAVCEAAGAARDRRAHRRQHCRPAQELFGKRQHGSVRHRRRLHPAL
jgi:Amidohydrolase family